ncbi:MAG: DUF4148 domain-containing protein [Achromobacter sp.]|nr:DUF4148 domain-containing protein [Achromobacter sp.]
MARFSFIALALMAAAAASLHAQPQSPTPGSVSARPAAEAGKTREQVLQELIAARKAGEVWRGNAEPPAFKDASAGRPQAAAQPRRATPPSGR